MKLGQLIEYNRNNFFHNSADVKISAVNIGAI